MSAKAQVLPAPADLSDVDPYDNSFRWWVRSRTNPKKRYLVDLSSYRLNGRCSCDDFQKRFEKYLTRGHDAAAAWEAGVLGAELRPYMMGINDALRCWHICRAIQKQSHCFNETLLAANAAQAPR